MPTLTRPLLPLLEEPGEMCCAPLAAAPLTEADADVLSGRLKALADPGRSGCCPSCWPPASPACAT